MSEQPPINFFEIQPVSCRMPLEKKDIKWDEWHLEQPGLVKSIERVLYFDPAPIYERVGHLIDPYKRHQSLSIDLAFPRPEKGIGKCTCGCDVIPKEYMKGEFHKWATPHCHTFASAVISIINNYFKKPVKYTTWYAGKICAECESDQAWDLQLDHIIGVKQGGGGCWLSNYRWLCHNCHVQKTNETFGRNGKGPAKNQIKMDI